MQVEEVRAWTVLGSGLHTFVVGDGQARSPKKGTGSEWGFGQVAKAKVSRADRSFYVAGAGRL